MNKLLIALLIVSSSAHAESLFEANNNANGKLVLTDELCRDGTNRLAYSTVQGYDTILGCWTADNSYVHIKWYEGSLRSYNYNIWRDVRKVKPTL